LVQRLAKITIKGADLKTPLEITDPKTLANFNVWTGPGTSWSGTSPRNWVDTFIIDWSQGGRQRPKGLQRYEVAFYAKLPNERLIYVVFYEYDPATQHGYVYLPGRTDEWYRLNVSTIIHGVEGRWFRASSDWDSVAPDGKHFLYLAVHHDPSKSANNALYYASLDGRENRPLFHSQSNAIYAIFCSRAATS